MLNKMKSEMFFGVALAAVAPTCIQAKADPALSFVVALNAPALATPSHSLGVAIDEDDEPEYSHTITELGLE